MNKDIIVIGGIVGAVLVTSTIVVVRKLKHKNKPDTKPVMLLKNEEPTEEES